MRLAVTAILLVICNLSSRGQDRPTIFVYAERNTAANSWRPIFCDSTPVAKLRKGTFFAMTLSPGQHVLSDGKGTPAIINLTAAQPQYVSLDWIYQVGRPPTSILSVVKQDMAQIAMKYLAYIDPNKVLSPSVLKADPRPPPELRLKSRPADEK